jgi:Flp pilus assembly protein TadG
MKRWGQDRGAVAVEFALILPVLLLLLLGIMEFGRAYNAQLSLTHAARESVRTLAIFNTPGDAIAEAVHETPTLSPKLTPSNVAVSYADSISPYAARSSCAKDRDAIITITYTLQTLTGLAGPFTLTGRGVMRCAG